jgi:hypothetical protein
MIPRDTIIKRLQESQSKSDYPNEYELALTEAFDFLGFKQRLLAEKGILMFY